MDAVQRMVARTARAADVRALRLNLALPGDFAAVRRLSEDGPMRYPPLEMWGPTLGLMPAVRVLILTSDAVAGILMALTPEGSVGGSSRTPLLPKLSTLVIVKSDLPDPRLYDCPPGLNIIGVLEAFLSRRLEYGLKLERLVIDSDNAVTMTTRSSWKI